MTNKLHDAFDRLNAPETLKASTLQLLREAREPRRRAPHPALRTALAACAVFVLFLGIGGYLLRAPVAYVSIDVNPSLELALNRFNRVVSTAAYNGAGDIVLDSVSVKGLLYTRAIDEIVESAAMRPYLTQDAVLTFTVAANNSGAQSELLTGIESCAGHRTHGARSYTADLASLPIAHQNGLSIGKYAAYLLLSQYDGSVTADDCRDMSIGEIHSQISAHERDGAHGVNAHEAHGAFGHE